MENVFNYGGVMKYIFLILAAVSVNGLAADYGYKQKSYGYESSAGRKYEYDTQNESDAIKYNSDYSAQQRDRLNSYKQDTYRNILEESYGDRKRGAGILDD